MFAIFNSTLAHRCAIQEVTGCVKAGRQAAVRGRERRHSKEIKQAGKVASQSSCVGGRGHSHARPKSPMSGPRLPMDSASAPDLTGLCLHTFPHPHTEVVLRGTAIPRGEGGGGDGRWLESKLSEGGGVRGLDRLPVSVSSHSTGYRAYHPGGMLPQHSLRSPSGIPSAIGTSRLLPPTMVIDVYQNP